MTTTGIQNAIIKHLKAHTGVPFIMANQGGEIPEGPHVVFNFIVPYAKGIGRPTQRTEESEAGLTRIQSEQYNVTLSLTAVMDWEESEACVELAQSVYDWFNFYGYDTLSAADIVVSNLTEVQSRDSVDDDEARRGFDAILRVSRELAQSIDWIERVEIEQF